MMSAALRPHPLDAFDDELAHFRLDRLDLAGSEPPGDQFAELGVGRRILHDHRGVVGQTDEFQLVVVDGEALRGGEGLVVAGRTPDVGVPGHHPVVMWRTLADVVHRIGIPECGVHRPGISPGRTAEKGEFRVRHFGPHVS